MTAKGIYGLHPFAIAEAVDIQTALRSSTAWGSRQMFLENKICSLEVGKKPTLRTGTATSTLFRPTRKTRNAA